MHSTMDALLHSNAGLLILGLGMLCTLGCLRALAAEAEHSRRVARLMQDVSRLREAQMLRLKELQEQNTTVDAPAESDEPLRAAA